MVKFFNDEDDHETFAIVLLLAWRDAGFGRTSNDQRAD
jgi:hypothetical protein